MSNELQVRGGKPTGDTIRDLIDLAQDFRGRGIYLEGETLLDAAPAALDALEAEIQRLHDALVILLRFARPVDIQACLVQGGVDVEAALGREEEA